MDAARYQEAYDLLSEEVGTLVARHQLAEEEAQRLSKFNVEILSHNNPAQRIIYVDRIRKELAETKHVGFVWPPPLFQVLLLIICDRNWSC